MRVKSTRHPVNGRCLMYLSGTFSPRTAPTTNGAFLKQPGPNDALQTRHVQPCPGPTLVRSGESPSLHTLQEGGVHETPCGAEGTTPRRSHPAPAHERPSGACMSVGLTTTCPRLSELGACAHLHHDPRKTFLSVRILK